MNPILLAVAVTTNAWSPIGQTEVVIIEKYGNPSSRMDLGDDTELIYTDKRLCFTNGVVAEVIGVVAAPEVVVNRVVSTGKKEDSIEIVRIKENLAIRRKDLEDANRKVSEAIKSEDEKPFKIDAKLNMGGVKTPSQNGYETYRVQSDKRADYEKQYNVAKLKEDINQLQRELLEALKKQYAQSTKH